MSGTLLVRKARSPFMIPSFRASTTMAVPCRAVQLQATTATIGSVPVVSFTGSLDLSSVVALRDHLQRAAMDHPGQSIVVDLDGVDALDDAGLGIMLGAAGRVRADGGELVVVASAERVRSRLALTGFDRAVRVAGGLAEVLTPE